MNPLFIMRFHWGWWSWACEVATGGQTEIDMRFDTMTKMADKVLAGTSGSITRRARPSRIRSRN